MARRGGPSGLSGLDVGEPLALQMGQFSDPAGHHVAASDMVQVFLGVDRASLQGIGADFECDALVLEAIDLGRHFNLAMSILISMLAAWGILLLLKTYALKISKKTSEV